MANAFISVTCSICCTDAVACRHRVCGPTCVCSIICEFYMSVLCEIVIRRLYVQFYLNRNTGKANTTHQIHHVVRMLLSNFFVNR